MAIDGGSVLTVCEAPNGRGGAWAPDGTIVFSPGIPDARSQKVRSTGGTPEPLTVLDAARHSTHRWPSITPDGLHVVYFAATHVFEAVGANEIRVVGLDGRDDRPLVPASGSGVVQGSLLLFPRDSTLVAQRLDVARARLEGEPQAIASGVLVDASTWQLGVHGDHRETGARAGNSRGRESPRESGPRRPPARRDWQRWALSRHRAFTRRTTTPGHARCSW